jgi:hypothetical protein
MESTWPDDILAVACVRVRDTDLVVPGSLVKTCSQCEAAIWVSPATREHIKDKAHRFVCMECMIELADKDNDPQVTPVTDEQLAEIRMTMEAGGMKPPTLEELRRLKDQIEREGVVPTARKVIKKKPPRW